MVLLGNSDAPSKRGKKEVPQLCGFSTDEKRKIVLGEERMIPIRRPHAVSGVRYILGYLGSKTVHKERQTAMEGNDEGLQLG